MASRLYNIINAIAQKVLAFDKVTYSSGTMVDISSYTTTPYVCPCNGYIRGTAVRWQIGDGYADVENYPSGTTFTHSVFVLKGTKIKAAGGSDLRFIPLGGVLKALSSMLSTFTDWRWRYEQVVQCAEHHHHETERRCDDYVRQFVSNDRVIDLRWKVLRRQKYINANWVQHPLHKHNVYHGQQDGNCAKNLWNKLPSVYEPSKHDSFLHGVLLQNHKLTSERGCAA